MSKLVLRKTNKNSDFNIFDSSPIITRTPRIIADELSNDNNQNDLNDLFSKFVTKSERKRIKDRNLIIKYDKLCTKAKEEQTGIFNTINIRLNKIINADKEKFLILNDEEPHLLTLNKNQKFFISIRIKKQKPPLRIYFKLKETGNFQVFVSRKIKFPDIEDHDSVYTNPKRIQVKGSHEEGVFFTEMIYLTIVGLEPLKVLIGYSFNNHLPSRDLLPDYNLPFIDTSKPKECRTTLEMMQCKFVDPQKRVPRK